MLFPTATFLVFFTIFYFFFCTINNQRFRHLWLLLASYVFYSWWDVRFLGLLLFSTVMDFTLAILIDRQGTQSKRKRFVIVSVICNLSLLGFFKYCNFFIDSANSTLLNLGFQSALPVLNIVLPIGVSFFTFEGMSYVIDVYWRRIPASRNILDYAVFIAFFPHLVAGPIIRPSSFMPQIQRDLFVFESDFFKGISRFMIGAAKKLLIADNLAFFIADPVLDSPGNFGSFQVLCGVYAYAFQIYFDFSGYSDMAIGLSKMVGIDLPENFNYPYLATSVKDFWTRWHISLSTWLKDYLYIPLGGGKTKTLFGKYRNIFITMALGGFWHGASWNFLIWGVLHGLFIIISHVMTDFFGFLEPEKGLRKWVAIAMTFHQVCLAWIFFRCTYPNAIVVIQKLTFFDFGTVTGGRKMALIFTALVLLGTYSRRFKPILESLFLRAPLPLKCSFMTAFALLIYFFDRHYSPFIYFQF